jgi:hypothetical protein
MAELSVDRKQRLRTLEKSIRGTMEQFVDTGNALKEIRDDELYREDGFDSWDAYLKNRVGEDFCIEKQQVLNLITAATIRPKLPDPKILPNKVGESVTEWKPTVVKEFARLAPQDSTKHGSPRDLSSLRKQDVHRVAKAAVEIAKTEGKPLTASIVRRAVDAELGIKPKTREPAQEQVGIELPVYLKQKIGQMEGIIELLVDVPADGWKQLEKSDPHLAERLATACDQLAELLRS